jgi:hypothetical protein
MTGGASRRGFRRKIAFREVKPKIERTHLT